MATSSGCSTTTWTWPAATRAQPAGRQGERASAVPTARATTPSYQIWTGKTQTYVHDRLPAAERVLRLRRHPLLRNAYELFKRDDLLSDLFAHLREQADAAAPPAEQLYPGSGPGLPALVERRQGRGHRRARPGRRAGQGRRRTCGSTLAELLRAARRARTRRWRWSTRSSRSTRRTMQRREMLALRLAVLTGNVDRARKAAERLFGLRLDTETQVQLAARCTSSACTSWPRPCSAAPAAAPAARPPPWSALMHQYQRQNKTDVAVQVAHQILRSLDAPARPQPQRLLARQTPSRPESRPSRCSPARASSRS